MGQEIVYCHRCQIRLTGADFDKGKAFQVADRASCAACLSDRDREAIQAAAAKDRRPAPLRADSPRSGTRALPARPAAKSALGLSVGIGAVALVVSLIIALSGGGRRPPPPPPAPVPAPVVVPDRAVLIAKDLEALDLQLRGPLDREDFKQALAFLQAAAARRREPEWPAHLEERAAKIRQAVDRAFSGLRDKAIAAARSGHAEELKAARERAAGWGRAAVLEAALADVAKPFQQGVDGLVAIEAEHYAKKIDRGEQAWTLQTMSGAVAMQVLPDRGAPIQNDYAPRSPQLDYPVRFTRTGTHYVWLRGLATTDAANSVHLGVDGIAVPGLTALSFSASSKWSWSKTKQGKAVASFEILSPGLHVIHLWMREDGAYVDRFVITPSDTFTPEREGPPESVR